MAIVDCASIRRLIHLGLDGELRDEDARLLEEHLEQCEECARFREELERVDAALREGLGAIRLPEPEFGDARQRVSRSRTGRAAWVMWLPAAAAFVLVSLALLVATPMLRGPEVAAAPAVVVRGGDAIHVFEPDQKTAQPGRTGGSLQERSVAWSMGGESIALEFAGGACVELSDEAVVRIGRDCLDLFKGDLRADLTGVREQFAVVTPWGEFRGADAVFTVQSDVDGSAARVTVASGEVEVSRRGWTRTLTAGEAVTLKPDPQQTIYL